MTNENPWEAFEWARATRGYRWVDVADAGRALVPTDGTYQGFQAERYQPFSRAYRGLYRRFATLDGSEDAVRDFANEFGLLGPPITRELWAGQLTGYAPAPIGVFDARETRPRPRTVKQSLLEYCELLGNSDDSAPPTVLNPQWTWRGEIRRMREAVELMPYPRAHVASVIQHVVNRNLQDIAFPFISWSAPRDAFSWHVQPHSLIGALWLQTASVFTDGGTTTLCPCGASIEISRTSGARTDARFCSNKCKVKAYRERQHTAQRLAAHGLSPATIAKQLFGETTRGAELRSKTKTVRGWLKK